MKQLNFPTDIDSWQDHSQNLMMSLQSRVFAINEYSKHYNVDVMNAKNEGKDYIALSQKGNVKEKSTPTRQTNEKQMVCEILSLGKCFEEVNNRSFTSEYFWSLLSQVTTTFNKKEESDDAKRKFSSLTKEVISNHTQQNKETTVPVADSNDELEALDNAVYEALKDTPHEESDNDEEEREEVITITINQGTNKKDYIVRKKSKHEAASNNVIKLGHDKMCKMNLPAMRHRKKIRIKREQKAIRESLYNTIVSTDKLNDLQLAIRHMTEPDDKAPFASWNTIVDKLL